jgi:hypothetical protein
MLGVPLSEDKLVPPSPVIEFLGVVIDCPNMQLRIPADKIASYKRDIALTLIQTKRRTLSLRTLHSLVGVLRHCSYCVHRGGLFLHHIQEALTTALRLRTGHGFSPAQGTHATALRRPRTGHGFTRHPIILERFALNELFWWDRCLSEWNGVTLIPPSISSVPHSRRNRLFTDACNTGMGAWLIRATGDAHYLLHAWSDGELRRAQRLKRLSMPFLELLAVVLAVLAWQNELADSALELRSDCSGVVHSLTSDYSSTPQSHRLLLSLYLITTINHVFIRFSHIPGLENLEADALSRAANRDTHQEAALLSLKFFALPSVRLFFNQGRLLRRSLPDYPSTIFEPDAESINVPPWQIQPTGHTTMESNDSSPSVTLTTNSDTEGQTKTL